MSTETHAVLAASELPNGHMKQVAFPAVAVEGGDVLLYNLDGKIHATSAYCTHYGAPLASGVLSSSARIVCPWHGACFNVCTGDIEDAPAASPIHSFPVQVIDGQIHVTAKPEWTTKQHKARPPALHTADQKTRGVIIIGGGSGAFFAVESLRASGYQESITILSKENNVPIDRPKLSKSLLSDVSKLQWKSAAELHIKYGVTIRLATEATSISTTEKTVYIRETHELMRYEKLILATGGIPRRIPIPGVDLENVYTFRTIEDSEAINSAAKEGKNAVVIGSSFIGMELVAVLAKRKLASLHVIGMEKVPFERVLGEEVGAGIHQMFTSLDVTFHMNSSVQKINPTEEENSKTAASVVITDSSGSEVSLACDFVVLGVGVRPATDFLKENKAFTLEPDGGIKVDEYLRVPNVPDVYAIGDIAHYKRPNGNYARVEHWNVAGNHGLCVGYNIANPQNMKAFDKVPVFWSALGQQLRYCGNGFGFEEVIIKGSPQDLKFLAYYVKQGKIIAVASMQNDPVVMKCSELLRTGKMPTPDEIKNGMNVLEVAL